MKFKRYISADLIPRVPTIIYMQKNAANNLQSLLDAKGL